MGVKRTNFSDLGVSTEILDAELRAIVDFARGSSVEVGFGYLDSEGDVKPESPVELWITCRMTHVFALAQMAGIADTAKYVEHGVRCLTNYFADPVYGGWFSAISADLAEDGSAIPVNDRKEAYAHAFVLLAATSAMAADAPGAGELLSAAIESQSERWFREDEGKVVESWDRSFTQVEDYRGANSNMHSVEAYLAAYDLVKERHLLDRAVGILRYFYEQSRSHNWRLPEHFSSTWAIEPEYNFDQPAHPFRPFGITPGHGLEWARLMLHARWSLKNADGAAPDWMLEGAVSLFNRACADGWDVDGQQGFVYTTDFAGQPVVRQRMHWVVCEAIAAGVVLGKVLSNEAGALPASIDNDFVRNRLEEQMQTWWNYCEEHLLAQPGRWNHELDPTNHLDSKTWDGRPDAYHVVQMLLLPRMSDTPTFAAALRDGLLDA